MEKFVMIATWCMSYESFVENYQKLQSKEQTINEVLVSAVAKVEDYPFYKSVGYGGLPNRHGRVQLDASFMDGDDLKIGAIASLEGFANPIKIAYHLRNKKYNSFLVGEGANEYALLNNFEQKNMLTTRALTMYNERESEIKEKDLSPYSGHDTVCMLGMDQSKKISVATSTSGLFMKEKGRVGDSPISGSGFYANSSYGGCAATGLGEDIMKTCISYQVVSYMREGYDAQQAADLGIEQAKSQLEEKYRSCGDISIVCCDKNGNYGAATTIDQFSYVVMSDKLKPTVMLVTKEGVHQQADQKWVDSYFNQRNKTVELK